MLKNQSQNEEETKSEKKNSAYLLVFVFNFFCEHKIHVHLLVIITLMFVKVGFSFF